MTLKQNQFYFLITFSILLTVLSIPSQALAEKSLDELKKEKLQKEIKLLDEQISDTQNIFQSNFFIQILAIVGIVAGVSATSFWAWLKEKNTPQVAEQEKLFAEIVKQWHSRSHLDAFNIIWESLEKDKNSLDKHWNNLSVKEFPISKYLDENWQKERRRILKKYLQKRLRIKDSILLDEKIKSIENSSAVEYYDVAFKRLPSLIQLAIDASMHKAEKNKIDIEKDSFENLKYLMIFTRTREDKEVVNILHQAALFNQMKKHKN